MKTFARVLVAMLALTLVAADARGQQSSDELAAIKKDLEALKATQLAIQKDVRNILAILERLISPSPAARGPVSEADGVRVSVAEAPVQGNPRARVALLEFSDYQCPFCLRHVRATQPQIDRDYVQPGTLRHFFLNLPIPSLHPQAFKAHEAAICAGQQDKYWEMHDRLFANQSALGAADLPKHASAIGLNVARFRACLDSGETAPAVRRDIAEAQKLGISGTPTFLVGLLENDGTVTGLKMIVGAQPYQVFKEALDEVLAEAR